MKLNSIGGALFFVLSLIACRSNNTIDATTTNAPLPESLQKGLDAHGGLDTWNTFNTLGYTLMKGEKPEMHKIDLPSRKVKIDFEDYSMGYDGEEVWITPDIASFGGGSPRFYHNLYFYFFAMPFVVADPGILYEELEDREFNGRTYEVVKVSYNDGVGDAPDDFYVLHFDKETHLLHLLLYTVTYYAQEKSEKFNAIIYDDWIDVKGLKLPGSYKGYKYIDGEIGEQRYERLFLDHYLSEIALTESTFTKPANAEVDPVPWMASIENGIMNLDVSSISLPSKQAILKKIRIYLKNEFDSPKAAFEYFDEDTNDKLERSEIKNMLEAADVGGLFLGLISKTMVGELDSDGDDQVDWPEFEKDVEKLLADD